MARRSGDKVTSNLVLYGQLTALTYDVTYNANLPANTDATVSCAGKQTKTHGEALTLVGEPTRLRVHLKAGLPARMAPWPISRAASI